MEFSPTEEQAMFREAVSRFAQEHLAPGAQARAQVHDFPWDVARLMAGQGLLGITIAADDGGQGGTLMDAVIAVEEVARFCPSSVDLVHAGSFGAIRTLAAFGSPEQKKHIYEAVGLDWEWVQGAFMEAMTDANIREEMQESTNIFRGII